MTTTVTVNPSSHHVVVEITDNYATPNGFTNSVTTELLLKTDPERQFYSTDTRSVSVTDIPHGTEVAALLDAGDKDAALAVVLGRD